MHKTLKRDYRLCCAAAEYAVLVNARDVGVIFSDHIQQILQRYDVLPAGTLAEDGGWRYGANPKRTAFAV